MFGSNLPDTKQRQILSSDQSHRKRPQTDGSGSGQADTKAPLTIDSFVQIQ